MMMRSSRIGPRGNPFLRSLGSSNSPLPSAPCSQQRSSSSSNVRNNNSNGKKYFGKQNDQPSSSSSSASNPSSPYSSSTPSASNPSSSRASSPSSLKSSPSSSKPVQFSIKAPNKGPSITFALPPTFMDALKNTGNKPSSPKAKAQASRALREEVAAVSQPHSDSDAQESQVGQVFAYATASSYDLGALIRSGRLPPGWTFMEDEEVIHLPSWPVHHDPSTKGKSKDSGISSTSPSNSNGEVFIFQSGSYVTWGMGEEQSKRFLGNVIRGRDSKVQVEKSRYDKIGDEVMDCLFSTDQITRIHGDIIVIGQPPRLPEDEPEDFTSSSTSTASQDSQTGSSQGFGSEWTPTLARLAFSQGLARSARLSVQESALSRFLSSVASIPEQLEKAGKVPLRRKEVIKQMGTLLTLRQKANLDKDNFFDEPEVYWENAKMEEHYRSICAELDISSRFETLNEKLDHCENLLGVVRALLTEATTHRMELIIIGLIAFEAGIALLSHGWIPPWLMSFLTYLGALLGMGTVSRDEKKPIDAIVSSDRTSKLLEHHQSKKSDYGSNLKIASVALLALPVHGRLGFRLPLQGLSFLSTANLPAVGMLGASRSYSKWSSSGRPSPVLARDRSSLTSSIRPSATTSPWFSKRIVRDQSSHEWRHFSTSTRYSTTGSSSSSNSGSGRGTPVGEIQPRLAITFTCAVEGCGHRSSHEFSKRSYTHGIVIIQCPSCKSRHLIADNLSWFTDSKNDPRTIEEIVKAKGGKVTRGVKYDDGEGGGAIEIEEGDAEFKGSKF
ncbi:hypothetical protein IE53DRAFT_385536 [Violaceomyces palustris]|uniref:Uncharacterized protein n=1 Tax=Violaceomyces palustris TaxID=1673888 RepID=A0ACD0P1S6_9BASI|nr:hypothetical protein IE53DRAFT_385536 [Violaceomyces palustris]